MHRPQGLWRVPPLWPNGECFILGGGPSLQDVNLEPLHDRRIIAVNNAYKLGNWIDVVFFGDCRWLSQYGKGLLDFAGLKVTTCEKHIGKPGIKVVKRKNSPHGLSRDRGTLLWNLSSGACAINLAVHLGVKRIVLLGFDMQKDGDRHNWHDDYESRHSKFNPYERFMRPFPCIAKDLKRLNIECINASQGSALKEFPIVKLEDIL